MRLLRLFLFLAIAHFPATGQIGSRGVAPELARYLQLAPEQAASLNQLAIEWAATLEAKNAQAAQLRNDILSETEKDQPNATSLGGYYLQLQRVCRETTAARTDLLQKTRAVLKSDQIARLQALEDALALMPRVLEAQTAGMIPDSIQTAPVGFPAGQISVALTFAATTPAQLPGCLATVQAQPGTVSIPFRRGRP